MRLCAFALGFCVIETMQFQKPFPLLSDAKRAQSLRSTLAAAPNADGVWIFGYGSLMWDPCGSVIERRTGSVQAHCRRLCVWSARARGTPERPGLGLGLERGGGVCHGIVYRLDAQTAGDDLKALWEREMSSGIYQPHWLPVETDKGCLDAITFVVDTEHPQHAKHLTRQEMVEVIAQASGEYGPCREYLEKTVDALAVLGVNDSELDALVSAVHAKTKRTNDPR